MRVSDIVTKAISGEDKEFSFAIKALVENDSDDNDVMIELQGIDCDGFEIYSFYLEGTIPIGECKVLTTKKDFIDKETFEQIVLWQTR